MSICYDPQCKHGPNGKRYSGAADLVHIHELAVHGKQPSGKQHGKDIVLTKSEFWVRTSHCKKAR